MKLYGDIKKYRKAVNELEERLFLLPPSFYAIVSGAFIGTATNLLTSLIFAGKNEIDPTLMRLAVLSIFFSSACFGYISLILEQERGRITEGYEATKQKRLVQFISGRRKILRLSVICGVASIIIGLVLIYCAANF